MSKTNIEAYNLDCDAAAKTAAEWLGLGNAIFKDIPVGGLFRFHTSSKVFRKCPGGWYRNADGTGGRFKTGARTAVFRVT